LTGGGGRRVGLKLAAITGTEKTSTTEVEGGGEKELGGEEGGSRSTRDGAQVLAYGGAIFGNRAGMV